MRNRQLSFLSKAEGPQNEALPSDFPIYRIGFLVPSSELDRHLQARRQLPPGQSRRLIYPLSKFDVEGGTRIGIAAAMYAQVVDVRNGVTFPRAPGGLVRAALASPTDMQAGRLP